MTPTAASSSPTARRAEDPAVQAVLPEAETPQFGARTDLRHGRFGSDARMASRTADVIEAGSPSTRIVRPVLRNCWYAKGT